jgi:hypothetical protein
VIVYGNRARTVHLPAFLADVARRLEALPSAPTHDAVVELFVDAGEVEPAVADALQPDQDDDCELAAAWSDLVERLAEAVCASAAGDSTGAFALTVRAGAIVSTLRERADVHTVRAGMAEGFACYGLYPEQFINAAHEWAPTVPNARLLCLGLRTIGSPLAHLFAAAARRRGCTARVRTVRPRGHPFDRRVALSARLISRLQNGGFTHAAVIDEGPGLSGSSFAAAAEALHEIGFPCERIVLVPSWNAPAEGLRSARARHVWTSHRRIIGRFEPPIASDPRNIDLSAGRWREIVLGPASAWPAAHPQHERRKFMASENGHAILRRFAGLGRYGRTAFDRSRAIAEAGFGPRPIGLEQGFLALHWADGRPQSAGAATGTLLSQMASYVAFLRQRFPADEPDDLEELTDMIRVNLSEADETSPCGERWFRPAGLMHAVDELGAAAARFAEPRVAIDGRLLPHEWIRSESAATPPVKVDATDHHVDDFFPGCRDSAWDVAGAVEEFELDASSAQAFVDRYRSTSGDRTIAHRLPFYRAAYLAYRMGYATLASESVRDETERERFTRAAARYRRSLVARLAASRAAGLSH